MSFQIAGICFAACSLATPGCSSEDLEGLFTTPTAGGDSGEANLNAGSSSQAGSAEAEAGAPGASESNQDDGSAGHLPESAGAGRASAGSASVSFGGARPQGGGATGAGDASHFAGSDADDNSNRAGTPGAGTSSSGTSGTSEAGISGAGTSSAGTSGTSSAGTSSAGTSGAGTSSAGTSGADLVLLYPFDEAGGSTATDASTLPSGPRNATLATTGLGSVGFLSTHAVGTHSVACVAGASGGGYLTVPPITDLAPQASTIASWVYVSSDTAWQRVFDFSSAATQYMFLTTQQGDRSVGSVRFAITTGGISKEQQLTSPKVLSTNAWHHLAVVLRAGVPYTGTLYVDGEAVASNEAMTLHAADLVATTTNYLCRSRFATDPYLTGLLDDFRVYRRALSAEDVAALIARP